MSGGVSRRKVLAGVAALLAGAAAWLLLPRRAAPLARATLLAPFTDPAAVSELGSRALREVPRWRDARLLSEELEPELRWRNPGFEARLAERVRADFREGRVQVIDGWVLSQTEAKLYALIELLP